MYKFFNFNVTGTLAGRNLVHLPDRLIRLETNLISYILVKYSAQRKSRLKWWVSG